MNKKASKLYCELVNLEIPREKRKALVKFSFSCLGRFYSVKSFIEEGIESAIEKEVYNIEALREIQKRIHNMYMPPRYSDYVYTNLS
ncbi:hypothetical protein GW932_00305 [archaeon]|nr:hypothetical protein [archaeon]